MRNGTIEFSRRARQALPSSRCYSCSGTKLLVIAFAVLLSGCVPYPINKTLQPEAEIVVTDRDGQPVADAWVHLISSAYPYGFEKSRAKVQTDLAGVVSFPKIKEWRMEALMLHGAEVYFWNWCVEKEGYETHVTQWRNSNDFVAQYEVTLQSGATTACPSDF